MQRRLYRSKTNKVISGVCGGIAEYFSIDPVLVRLVWIAACFAFATGIIIYIIASFIMPEKKADPLDGTFDSSAADFSAADDFDTESFKAQKAEWSDTPKADTGRTRMVFGAILVLIGLLALTKQFFSWLDFKYLLPIILVAVGALILFKGGRKSV